jgi:hypothetical protein
MKWIITLPITLTLCGAAIAQPIIGIGELNIGMTMIDFLELPEIKSMGIHDISERTSLDISSTNVRASKGKVWKNTQKSEINYGVKKIYSSDITEFEFLMSTGVVSSSTFKTDWYPFVIRFFNNELIRISITQIEPDSQKFIQLLTDKYGGPTKDEKTNPTLCWSKFFQEELTYLNGSIVYNWGSKAVKAQIRTNQYCAKKSTEYYIIDEIKDSLVNKIEQKIEREINEAESKKKASSSRL